MLLRPHHWLPGICAGAVLCVIALFLLIGTADDSCGVPERTDYLGSLDEVFASHSQRVGQPPSAAEGAAEVVERGDFVRCDYWPSGWAEAMALIAVFVALPISGALGARLGSSISPSRGAAASALGCLLWSLWILVQAPQWTPLVLEDIVAICLFTLTAGVVGYIGGYVVLIRARRADGAWRVR